jgi:4-amino-4-deoxy-L-arabinose transferase-like glycosyltransferase
MEKRLSKIYPQKWVRMILLAGFCFLLYFFNLGRWDLWNPDEPRYAQVAREMVNGGDWILMHFNGRLYEDKPPLFFWLLAFSSQLLGGFHSFSVRAPSALFGTLTVLLTFLLGKTLYTSRTGFLSGFILATSLGFAYLSTRANIDTTLAFFTTASLLSFCCWGHTRKEERQEGRGGGFIIYGFYLAMALATLAKGPVGFILPLSVGLIYLLVQKDWKEIKAMKLLPGMALFLCVVFLWYGPALFKGGEEYLQTTLLHHTVDRFAKGTSHIRPVYYYLYNFPVDFLPWIFFLPAGVAYGFSRETVERRKNFLFLLTWVAFIFLFFSLSKGKRGLYLLPLFPAASVMIGKLWDDFLSVRMDHFKQEWISFTLYGFIGCTLVAGAVIPWVVSTRFPAYLFYSLPIAFIMVGGSLALFVLYRFKNYGAVFFLLVAIVASGFFYTLRVVFPLINPHKSARFVCQEITSRIQPGERLGLYGGFVTAPYNFYTGIVPIQELDRKEDLLYFLRSPDRVFCLLKFRDFLQYEQWEGKPGVEVIVRRMVGSDDIVLISNEIRSIPRPLPLPR